MKTPPPSVIKRQLKGITRFFQVTSSNPNTFSAKTSVSSIVSNLVEEWKSLPDKAKEKYCLKGEEMIAIQSKKVKETKDK